MRKTAIHIIGALTALVIVLSLVFGCGVFLFACSKNDKNIYDVDLNNLDTYYLTSSKIDFNAVTLSVTYDDWSTDVFKKKEYDIKGRKAADDTEFIINTDGLYDQVKAGGDLTPGTYDISVSVPSYKYEKDCGTVTVGDDYVSDLYVLSYEAPELMSSFNKRSEEASSAEDDEDKFYQRPVGYFVGDDNEFVFKPVLTVINWISGELGTFSDYAKEFSVTLADDGESTHLDDSEYFSVSADDFSVQFTPAAVGKTFKVEVSAPKGFTVDDDGYELESFSMDVTVADGWNVYSAEDLGMMNLTSNTINRQEYVITDSLGNRSDYNQQLSGAYFWDEDKKEMTDKDTVEIWTNFLKDNGYDASSPVNGMFLHSDISITTRDFPEDFIITESEAKHFGCNYDEMVGSVRDGVKLYEKYMEDGDFRFNGNLFTVDVTSLKWAMTYIDSDGKFDHYTEDKATTYRGGRLSLFAVQGKVDTTLGSGSRPTATFENLGGIGNAIDSNDIEGKEAGSYTFIESISSQTVVDNCHARNFLYGLRAEDSGENYVNLTVNQTKVYDCYFAGMRLTRAADNEIYNSQFKRFSGPAIFLMSELEADAPKYGGYYKSGVTNDETTILESYISGSEAWFVSSNATSIGGYISMADGLIQACSADADGNPTKTITREDGKMNMTIFEQGTDDFGCGSPRLNTYYRNGNAVPFILNESTIEVKNDGTHETLDDFGGDQALYNAACLNYFVDGVEKDSWLPIPAVFASNTGTLVAIDNLYEGFYSPVDLRDNDGYALGEEYTVSLSPEDNQLCVYYRMDSVNGGTGLCLIVDLMDII
ncbi:MAG: hypothetical protein LUD72_14285 [Bacteroidales bacterium]|nr:hypothetical protein [Bacteroidales bacterium]